LLLLKFFFNRSMIDGFTNQLAQFIRLTFLMLCLLGKEDHWVKKITG